MSLKVSQSFHLANPSPWPLSVRIAAGILVVSVINFLYSREWVFAQKAILILTLAAFQWWVDVSKESLGQGWHSKPVQNRLKIRVTLLIASEALFFFSFFWSLFHLRLSPSQEIGGEWPPFKIEILPYSLAPLLNTLILLTRGFAIT